MRNNIVTKRGDKGTTGTLDGRRVSKASDEIEFVGALDELQSFLGLIKNVYEITEIQFDLYKIMGNQDVDVERLDGYIANLTIPNLDKFVLPTGYIHVARSVCRRAERVAVSSGRTESDIKFLNRLSDYLYILSFNN